jgi:hypothetical protein
MIGFKDGSNDAQITCRVCGSVFFVRDQIGINVRQIPIHNQCEGAGTKVTIEPLSDIRAIQECKEFYKRLVDILLT